MKRQSPGWVILLLTVGLLLTCLASLIYGAADFRLAEIFAVFKSRLGFSEAALSSGSEAVIWHLRFPRTLFAALVGATLAVSGAMMQGLFRNPLADPSLIGISSGAALGAVVTLVLGGAFLPGIAWLSDQRFLPVTAFIGALAVTYFVYRISLVFGYSAVATLLLAGVAVNSIASALIGLSMYLASDEQMRSLTFWTLGSLGLADWEILAISAPVCLLLLIIAPFFAGPLNALSLGEAEAMHLGFNIEKVKRWIIFLAAAGVGICVAFTGIIGFVGLVVPHLIRLWIGPEHRKLLIASALLGALLLTLADTCARTIVAPAELPIGILTAAFGGPFFLVMLLRQRSRLLRI
ncbi:MAG: FecCD family ABC transporter permease [Chthoniobacterales bacterium]